MINQYVMCKHLGKGNFGKVKLVWNIHDQKFYAMKVMSKSMLQRRRTLGKGEVRSSWDNVKKEVAIMKKLHHDNVVRLFEVIDDARKDKLFLGELLYDDAVCCCC